MSEQHFPVQKLPMIRTVRIVTRCGLKDAKEIIDSSLDVIEGCREHNQNEYRASPHTIYGKLLQGIQDHQIRVEVAHIWDPLDDSPKCTRSDIMMMAQLFLYGTNEEAMAINIPEDLYKNRSYQTHHFFWVEIIWPALVGAYRGSKDAESIAEEAIAYAKAFEEAIMHEDDATIHWAGKVLEEVVRYSRGSMSPRDLAQEVLSQARKMVGALGIVEGMVYRGERK